MAVAPRQCFQNFRELDARGLLPLSGFSHDPRGGLAEILTVARALPNALAQIAHDSICYKLGRLALHLVKDALTN
jgi:hypothetical protein